MTCFSCPRPAITTVVLDYDGETVPVCTLCARVHLGDFDDEEEEGVPTGGHIMDGYEDNHVWHVWE